MISDDNKVYMIDVCDTIPLEHPKTTIRSVKD
jgi:serine/threonine-protein kinase RIO1